MMALSPRGRLFLQRFAQNRAAVASAWLLLALALAAILSGLLQAALGLSTDTVDLHHRLALPSLAHPLEVGIAGALAAAVLGTAIGLVAGYRGGWVDGLLMRATDAVIALPLLPLLIVLAAIDLRKLGVPAELARSEVASLYRIVALVTLVGWTTVARIVRGATLSLKTQDYVRAAVGLGAGPARVMLVHILPNLASPVIVATALSIGNVILLESVLSFLGLGIAPPLASWGAMLSGAQETITIAPLLAVYPGLLIFLVVVACNLVGDGLRDALDPRTTARRGLAT
jgi:peptide/nickel transport system permease protein